jgi:hypothetical protein
MTRAFISKAGLSLLSLLVSLLVPQLVFAQDITCDGGKGIDTAIGCIPFTTESGLFTFILGWAIGIAGGIAFLLIIVAGFLYITSAGDPKKVQAAKELLTAAITGLLFLIFSAFILRVIGVDILGLPGF